MKRSIFLMLLSYIPVALFSQVSFNSSGNQPVHNQVLDTTVLQVYYELRYLPDSLNPNNLVDDYFVLEIGKKGISKFYSDNARRRDSIMSHALLLNPTDLDIVRLFEDNGISSGGDEQVIFKNFPLGSMTVTDKIIATDYLYEDGFSNIPWQVFPDTLTILSHRCQKAMADFRGRQYEAWFTLEIPVSEGPWKFLGLPGLILQVSDLKKQYVYECDGIRLDQQDIRFAKRDYLKTSRTEMEKTKRRFMENPMEFIRNSMAGVDVRIEVISDDNSPVTPEEIKVPYNPIELE